MSAGVPRAVADRDDNDKKQVLRRFYNRPLFGTPGNLVINSNFTSGTNGWNFVNMLDGSGNPMYSIVRHGDKSWLKINQEMHSMVGARGIISQTIEIPQRLRNKVLEVSFLVTGLFPGFRIHGDGTDFVLNVKIDNDNKERVYYYYHPDGASSFTLSFLKGERQSYELTEVAVREATWKSEKNGIDLPKSGGTLQLARWLSSWDEKSQHMQLANIRKIGGVVRVWLSGELFGSYIVKSNPTKRVSPQLTVRYRDATTANVFTGLDAEKSSKLDWFFTAARQHDLKVIVTLFGGFTDGSGNPHADLSLPLSLEFLDTDSDIRAGFNQLASSIVHRYAQYDNIVAWELVNEGWGTWRGNYSGYAPSADYSNDRPLSFAGYRDWEKSAYAAVKNADPKRPVMLNSGDSDSLYLLNSDSVCDWSGVSEYLGAIRITRFSGSPTRFYVLSGRTNSLANGTPLKLSTTGTFPAGLNDSDIYYVTRVASDSFEVASSPGAAGMTVRDGTGPLTFYSTDGTSVAAFDNIFQRWADSSKPVILAEMGAPANVGRLLYRDDHFEAAYLREGFKRLARFGFLSGIVFDESPGFNILWDKKYNLNKSGAVTATFGTTGKSE